MATAIEADCVLCACAFTVSACVCVYHSRCVLCVLSVNEVAQEPEWREPGNRRLASVDSDSFSAKFLYI